MPSPFIDFRNIRYHFCSADVIGSKPVFVTTKAAAGGAVGLGTGTAARPLGRLAGKVFAVFHQRSSSSRARNGWPEAETTVLPACESRPSFGENQADESASNRENPPGRPIRTVPFVRVSAASGLL
jgi:hypothetical protein